LQERAAALPGFSQGDRNRSVRCAHLRLQLSVTRILQILPSISPNAHQSAGKQATAKHKIFWWQAWNPQSAIETDELT